MLVTSLSGLGWAPLSRRRRSRGTVWWSPIWSDTNRKWRRGILVQTIHIAIDDLGTGTYPGMAPAKYLVTLFVE